MGVAPHPLGRLARAGVAAALLLAACSPSREIYPRLERLAAAGRYPDAVKLVEDSKGLYGEKDEVLYQLDRGVFLNYAGRYQDSNAAFERAEQRIDALFTESISGNVGAFISNDNTLPYKGEDFEAVVINIYRALNYAQLGDIEAALVEARKVDQKLDFINRQYEPAHRNAYKEDAFARMLMGVFYETGGTRSDLNDAFISFRLAAGIYEQDFLPTYGTPVPGLLKANLLSTAQFMGGEELGAAQKRFPGVPLLSLDDAQRQGQVYVVHLAGRAPTKVETSFNAIMPDGNLFRMAVPAYRRLPYLITGSRVYVDGTLAATLELAHPTGAIAVKSLENRLGRIRAKAVARAVTKYLANRALQERARNQSEGVRLLAYVAGNVASAVSEQADLRAWQTLPDRILIGRAALPPGKHRISVEFTTGAAIVVGRKEMGEIEVPPGRTRFMVLHTNT
jgi:hypothetical protein